MPRTASYSHSAAIQYGANHPCHTIPKFGPYLLSHNLSEGGAEFGKVKPGLYTSWGEEAAIKLIIRHKVDSVVCKSNERSKFSGFVIFLCSVVAPASDKALSHPTRMLKHPNTFRLTYTTLSKPTSSPASFSITPQAVNCSITSPLIAFSKKRMFIPFRPALFPVYGTSTSFTATSRSKPPPRP